MRIGVIGLNHQVAPLELRERVAHLLSPRSHPICCSSHLVLSTCNRTEIYFSAEELSDCHTSLLQLLQVHLEPSALQSLYCFFGEKCLHHLLRVTAGLDSAIVAETEIQGQVRRSYELARQNSFLTKELHFLFQKSLQTAKRVRTLFFQGRPLASLEELIGQLCQQLAPDDAPLLFLGASAMNGQLIAHCKRHLKAPLHLCNRDPTRGKAFAEQFNLQLLPWEERSAWPSYAIVLAATTAGRYLLTEEQLLSYRASREVRAIVDLSLPRNAEPALEHHLALYQIDQLHQRLQGRRNQLGTQLEAAEDYLQERSYQLLGLWQGREERLAIPSLAFIS